MKHKWFKFKIRVIADITHHTETWFDSRWTSYNYDEVGDLDWEILDDYEVDITQFRVEDEAIDETFPIEHFMDYDNFNFDEDNFAILEGYGFYNDENQLQFAHIYDIE